MLSLVIIIAVYLLVVYGMYNALLVFGPIDFHGKPWDSYRIVFFHVPLAVTSYVAFTVTLIFSILYLAKRKILYDEIASKSAKLGLVFATLTLVSGIIFSKEGWGTYWHWDPRQTSMLILWFVYAGYLVLRSTIINEEQKSKISAVYGIFGYATIPLTYLSTKLWYSLHPTASEFGLSPSMKPVLVIMILSMIVLYAYMLRIEVKLEKLEKTLRGKLYEL